MLAIRSVKGLASFLSQMWSLFSGSGSRLACHVPRVNRSTRVVWKARVWLAATHYFKSRITDYVHQGVKTVR